MQHLNDQFLSYSNSYLLPVFHTWLLKIRWKLDFQGYITYNTSPALNQHPIPEVNKYLFVVTFKAWNHCYFDNRINSFNHHNWFYTIFMVSKLLFLICSVWNTKGNFWAAVARELVIQMLHTLEFVICQLSTTSYRNFREFNRHHFFHINRCPLNSF